MEETSFIATGDAFITRRLPEKGYKGFGEIQSILKAHQLRFSNLEMTVHRGEGYPAAFSGGTWAMAEPEVLDGLLAYGFNLFNTANNHSLDYSIGGLLATGEQLRQRGVLYAGTGRHLAEAAAPVYLETEGARVALLAISASFHDSDIAGAQSAAMQGRPGLNPLRFKKIYYVPEKDYEALKRIAEETGMDIARRRSVENGYAQPLAEGQLDFGGMSFRLGERAYMDTEPDKRDVERTLRGIEEARRQADYVLISLHAHTAKGEDMAIPAGYIESFAHACIDGGADAVIGHGPHVLRGIEIYKKRPIFYSLGNFIFQTETVALQPAEAYEKNRMSPDATVGELMDKRSQKGSRGFRVDKNIWRSVMAAFTARDGRIEQIRLYPIELGMELSRGRLGSPRLDASEETLAYMQTLSKPYGTDIEIEQGIGIIRL